MGQTKTTIELNGKIYDASTGTMVGGQDVAKPSATKPIERSGNVVDGFFRRPGPNHLAPTAKPTPSAKPRAVRSPLATGHKTERSHTLMRHAVQRPTPSPATSVQSTPAAPKTVATTQFRDRQNRAQKVAKSTAVSHFGRPNTATFKPKLMPLAVQPHPHKQPAVAQAAPPITSKKQQPTAASSPFNDALRSASSHQQPALRHQKLHHRAAKRIGVSNRAISIAASSLVVILLAGFIAYQNVPNISMRLAASQAGFHANFPGYTPGGFGMSGPIRASAGVVTVSFRSHTDNRRFEINQRPSNWTSDSLRNNFVATSKQGYQTVEDKGKTIYIYNGSNATWVNGGIWYRVASSNGNLSSDQLIRIADSL